MKRIASLLCILLLTTNAFALNELRVINSCRTLNLYFNTIAMSPNCGNIIREHNLLATMSSYCELAPGTSAIIPNYVTFATLFPGINQVGGLTYETNRLRAITPMLADAYASQFNIDWAYIIYKVQHPTNPSIVEGEWLGFPDYYACHGLTDFTGQYGSTYTEAEVYSNFSIGGVKYFVVGEY